MKYEIVGGQLPVVKMHLENGESVFTESGGMTWMSPNMVMETEMRGGMGKAIGRMFSGESLMMVNYTAQGGEGEIAFASSYPGSIIPIQLNGNSWTLQKHSFLVATQGIQLSAKVNRPKTGVFGGEGFVMQHVEGTGIVFLELDGHIEERTLAAGEVILVDSSCLAGFEDTVTYDIERIKGAKNIVFGGEGLFNTKLIGPGKIYLQSMTMRRLAADIQPFIVTN